MLALVFLYLSVDEGGRLHEASIAPMQRRIGTDIDLLHYAWVVPAGICVAIFGLIYLRFWWSLPPLYRWLIFASAVLYIGGAAGLEMVSGVIVTRDGALSAAYLVSTTVEESLEMLGMILLVHTLLLYVSDKTTLWRDVFGRPGEE